VGRFGLRMMGWRIEGTLPQLSKLVLIVAPHTSNWDFIVAILGKLALQLDAQWLGKRSIFFWPLGSIMRRLGGIPVDRSAAHGIVGQAVDLFHNREWMWLGLSPEGTRQRVDRWKTGFYQIALNAGVPVLLISLDYSKKVIGIGPVMQISGDMTSDLLPLRSFYQAVKAKHPELFALPSTLP
jgi:1-acyl-sn-glycerol-3-phosphate acyltransferase